MKKIFIFLFLISFGFSINVVYELDEICTWSVDYRKIGNWNIIDKIEIGDGICAYSFINAMTDKAYIKNIHKLTIYMNEDGRKINILTKMYKYIFRTAEAIVIANISSGRKTLHIEDVIKARKKMLTK